MPRSGKASTRARRPIGRAGAAGVAVPPRRLRDLPLPPRGLPPIAAPPAGEWSRGLARLVGLAERPLALLTVALLATVGLGYGVTRLQTDASASLLADTGSAAWAEQVRFAQLFGGDPVVVMVQPATGDKLLTPDHMVGLAQLEGALARLHGVRKVYGPGTLVNAFAGEVTKRALDLCGSEGKAAQERVLQAAQSAAKSAQEVQQAGQQAFDAAVKACAQRLAARYPTLSVPALNNPSFFDELLLEPNGKVRPYWRSVLPDPGHALISVRLEPQATLRDVEGVVDTVRRAPAGAPSEQVVTGAGQRLNVPTAAGNLRGLEFTVTGTPVLAADLARAVTGSLTVLLPVALAAMLLITALVLRVPYRWLAIPVAALAGGWTAGAAGLLRLPLTPATLAVLPVVLGLSTDYVLQAANRLAEEPGRPHQRLLNMAAAILPPTGVAALATAAGSVAFALSSLPLVRQFGLFLALGVAMSWLASCSVGLPLLRFLAHRWPRPPGRQPEGWSWLARGGRMPLSVVVPLAVVGLAGWAALPWVQVETDPVRLLPPGSPALQQAEAVRKATGVAGELDVVLTGPDVTTPVAVAWLGATEQSLEGPQLIGISGLPDFLLAFNYNQPPDAATTRTILDRLPTYFTGAVVSPDHHVAVVTLGVTGVNSVEEDRALVSRVEKAAGGAPAGYRAYPAGLAVLAAGALSALQAEQLWLNLLALALVLAVLLIAFRHPVPALLAVVPTAVAAGWVTAAVELTGARQTPLTALLAGVVVAFATEFGVLWLTRYRAERRAGETPELASEAASRRLGPAIVAAALALAAGFAALAGSQIPMLRAFGLWCAADLLLATVAVLVLLPPAARTWLR